MLSRAGRSTPQQTGLPVPQGQKDENLEGGGIFLSKGLSTDVTYTDGTAVAWVFLLHGWSESPY